MNWPESIKALQRNWIGRSEGAEVDFFIGSGSGAAAQRPVWGEGFEAWKAARKVEPRALAPGPMIEAPAAARQPTARHVPFRDQLRAKQPDPDRH